MTDPLVIGVVTGVTPDKWVRAWTERMPDVPLRVRPVHDASALFESSTFVLLRLPVSGAERDALHVIPLWEKLPLVVAAKDHPIAAFETLTVAELADEELYPGWDDATLDIVAAGHGIARMPQSVFRASGRRDLVGRALSDAEPTRIALAWLRTSVGPEIDEFVGIVRGRTAQSSRGVPTPPSEPEPKKAPTRPATPKGRSKTPRGPRKNGGRAPGRRR